MTSVTPEKRNPGIQQYQPRYYEEEQLQERRCHLRVQSCCCCCPVSICSATAIAIIVLLEFAASAIAREWINAFLQLILISIMTVIMCALRHSERGRLVMYQAYAFVLLLNFIEVIAMSIVYFGVFDTLKEICDEFQVKPPEEEILQFNTASECEYNLRLMLIAIIGTGCLVYFPMKVHFMLVLRAFWKEKLEQNETLALQELMKQTNRAEKKRAIAASEAAMKQGLSSVGMAAELGQLQRKQMDCVEVIPGLETPETARKGLLIGKDEIHEFDVNTQGTVDQIERIEDGKHEEVTPYEMQRMRTNIQEEAKGVDVYEHNQKPEEIAPYERGNDNYVDQDLVLEETDYFGENKNVRLPHIEDKYKRDKVTKK